jgi:preprotein translocase subunit SecG
MTLIFVILIIIASVILGLVVLIQNPKGGGLAGNIAGFSTQFMGVKQTTDVLEKGTWLFAGIIGVLCLASTVFISKTPASNQDKLEKVGGAPVQNTQPANTTPFQTTPTNPSTTTPQ